MCRATEALRRAREAYSASLAPPGHPDQRPIPAKEGIRYVCCLCMPSFVFLDNFSQKNKMIIDLLGELDRLRHSDEYPG